MTHSLAEGALLLSRDGPTATLTLNRPDKRNALNRAMWAALPEALAAVAADREALVLVLAGAGGAFASGADIGEFESVYATRGSAAAYDALVSGALEALATFEKPTLAAIRGACVGGGLALALACDLRLAAEDARLGITPAKLGLMYSLADTKRLADAVGPAAAKDILFTGRLLDAAEALRIGLVQSVHPAEALAGAAADKAAAVAAASQWSVRSIKRVVRAILDGAREDDAAMKAQFLDALGGEDFREGRDAFLAKRPPRFPFR